MSHAAVNVRDWPEVSISTLSVAKFGPRSLRTMAVAALAALSACESAPTLPVPEGTPEQAWQMRLHSLARFDNWRCVGRVGVTDGKDGFSASLRWQQFRDRYEIRLTGPLGQGVAQVTGTPEGVALRTAEQGLQTAPTAEALLEQNLGWPLPVSGLRFWLLGITVPETAVDARELDRWGRLVRLEQSGWNIRYLEYARVDGLDLPSSVELDHGAVSARISVSRWEPGT